MAALSRKNKLPSPAANTGYVRKLRREQEAKQPKPAKPLQAPTVEKKPLPEGLPNALKAMGSLARHVKDISKVAFSVSIDHVDNEWVLVCRGFEPSFAYYAGYPVKFIKAHSFVPNRK